MRWPVVFAACSLASCNYRAGPLPADAELARMEKALSSVPCVGPIDGWERSYRYHLEPNNFATFLSKLDRNLIDFKLLRAGKFARAGLSRLPPYPPSAYELDSTPTDIAWGSYNLQTGKLNVEFCGSNIPK